MRNPSRSSEELRARIQRTVSLRPVILKRKATVVGQERRDPRMPDEDLILSVETDDGVYIRRVMRATALPEDSEVGGAAEAAARSAAATYGLPDFVFRSRQQRVASGTREIGDALLIVGDMAAVIQIKARATDSSNDSTERGWLDKRIRKAMRQAQGTIRQISRMNAALSNERGRWIEIEGGGKRWIPVVVVDHPNPPAGYTPKVAQGIEAVVLLRRDWEFLFDQLKSTHAVVGYLARVSELSPIPLGEEPVRYYELAAVDVAAPPGPVDPRLVRPGLKTASTPVLPQTPAGAEERPFHVLIRILLEDIATSPRPHGTDEARMLDILAAVDTLPVGYRAELGNTLMAWLHDVLDADPDDTRWRIRSFKAPTGPHLIFAAATGWDPAVQNGFSMLVTLRHQQMFELLDDEDELLSVGVLLTPRHDGRRPWDTTMVAVAGDLELDAEYRGQLEALWPVKAAPD